MASSESHEKTISVFSSFTSPFEESPRKDAGSSLRKRLSLWPGIYHSPVTNALWHARSSIFERLLDPSMDAPPQSQLLSKTPSQSRTSILYNFSGDYILRELYRDPWNNVRIGKLLEDLDALASTIAVKHCVDEDSTTRPLILVTASVDKMVLKKPIRVDTDLKVSGAVTWVGRSSLDIQMMITQPPEGNGVVNDDNRYSSPPGSSGGYGWTNPPGSSGGYGWRGYGWPNPLGSGSYVTGSGNGNGYEAGSGNEEYVANNGYDKETP